MGGGFSAPIQTGLGDHPASCTIGTVSFPGVKGPGRGDDPFLLAPRLTFSRLMTYIYIYRTAQLTSRCCILYIYSTNIRTEYFKHAAHTPFFPLQNATFFGSCIIHILNTGCAKI